MISARNASNMLHKPSRYTQHPCDSHTVTHHTRKIPQTPLNDFSLMSSTMDDFPKLTHGNYHAWAPRMTAKLQRLGIWRFCMGNESIPAAKPTAISLPDNATTSKKLTVERNLSEATQSYNDACRQNDQAVGTIMTKIELSKYSSLKKKSAKEVWDVLKA